jgi:hypothetical protein
VKIQEEITQYDGHFFARKFENLKKKNPQIFQVKIQEEVGNRIREDAQAEASKEVEEKMEVEKAQVREVEQSQAKIHAKARSDMMIK